MYVVVVLDISVQVLNGDTDDCHLTIVPVCPLNVKVPLVEPEHTLVPPVTLPPTEAGLTITVVGVDVSGVQLPL